MSSAAPETDENGGAHGARKEKVKPEDEGIEVKEPLSAVDPEKDQESLDLKDHSYLEAGDENMPEANVCHSLRADPKASSTLKVPEDHTAQPVGLNEPASSGMENGITSGLRADLEPSEAVSKVDVLERTQNIFPKFHVLIFLFNVMFLSLRIQGLIMH